ncbi:hypothetical protein [Pseudomonas rubra]|uniref:DUF1453 domain-containing protein n=1 Tax=Pseudomonas rubra TaxID=2942627 RepID=A0ABT5PEC9_9PSED|nr:hypothetical protein [Pseudomonas rubra]MDD1016555.1 hypothetical protein [Pseudomonas rubra]MDD1039150.1 hypothetical protein [Pseudomonas rubra]MDD1157976.1 hypothetical protein [Pseudomonas rubra]
MLDALEGTPLWVYGVFLLVCYYGFSARTASRESPRSLIITPSIVLIWSCLSLRYADSIELTLGSWLAGIILGSLAAQVLFSRRGLALDDEGQALVVPGTWKVLGISLLFFAVKYFIGYQAAVHPERSASAQMLILSGAASGFTVGLFCGRAVMFYREWLSLRGLKEREPTA